ncbi:hypothetical protein A3D66_02570 [Candidatus Kaiserbacteria bacterium RIFCSPHIGHO2_02_FULL_50_9]|nr:MAG: hypothetical protein A3D66_02570 [Candidatus Kaiserbacteria bacterium RIFCSPHIGHO2_02_FULL_50_9]
MSRESSILLLGIIVVLTRFSGLPSSWKNTIFFVCGVVIAILAFLLRRRRALATTLNVEKRSDSYVQNNISGIRL